MKKAFSLLAGIFLAGNVFAADYSFEKYVVNIDGEEVAKVRKVIPEKTIPLRKVEEGKVVDKLATLAEEKKKYDAIVSVYTAKSAKCQSDIDALNALK